MPLRETEYTAVAVNLLNSFGTSVRIAAENAREIALQEANAELEEQVQEMQERMRREPCKFVGIDKRVTRCNKTPMPHEHFCTQHARQLNTHCFGSKRNKWQAQAIPKQYKGVYITRIETGKQKPSPQIPTSRDELAKYPLATLKSMDSDQRTGYFSAFIEFAKGDNCPIDQQPLSWGATDDDYVVVALPCCHFFHRLALNNWAEESNTCPTCKANFDISYVAETGVVNKTHDVSSEVNDP